MNVKAVNVLSLPLVGLKTAIRLWVPLTVPSAGVIETVCVVEPDEVKVIQLGRVVAPVPSSHYSESKAPVVAQSLLESESMKHLSNAVFDDRASVFETGTARV